MSPIVVSGLGVVSPVGHETGTFWRSLVEGRDVIAEASRLPGSGLPVAQITDTSYLDGLNVPVAACDPAALFAVAAAHKALAAAGLSGGFANPARVAVILGNGGGGLCSIDDQYVRLYRENRRPHPMSVAKVMVSSSASWVSIATGAKGPCFVTASACASAAHAIGIAMQLMRAGLIDIAITGGAEAPLSYGTVKAWDTMRVMSRKTCRPFALGRDGLLLGEGAGILILETQAHAESRGHRSTIEAAGFGFSADAGDIVSPDVDGMAGAMRLALDDAGIAAGDVAYVNAHGTGTRANDRTETQALKRIFGEGTCPPISSTKAVTGHALGAAGGIEAVATILAMQHSLAPPTANFDGPDPDCDLDVIPNEARAMAIPVAMSNSFAFGGLNASLVFRTRA